MNTIPGGAKRKRETIQANQNLHKTLAATGAAVGNAVGDAIDSFKQKEKHRGTVEKAKMELATESKLPSKRVIVIGSAVVVWIATGMIVLCTCEDFHAITAFYVLVQMITTIGYGDVTVQTSDATKWFLSFYVLFCCVVVGGFLIGIADWILQSANESLVDRFDKIKDDYEKEHNPEAWQKEHLEMEKKETDADNKFYHKHESFVTHIFTPLTGSGLGALGFLLMGTFVYGIAESCTCSFAESKIDGCDPDNCEATGGATKSFLDAWYMACVSLTTVGFGDYSPKTEFGRLFSCFWMMMGVAAIGNFAVQFSGSFLEADHISKRLNLDIWELYDRIDADGNGKLDKFEFLTFALMEYGMVSEEDMEAVFTQFENMDEDKSGYVTREEILKMYKHVRQEEAAALNNRRLSALIVEPVHEDNREHKIHFAGDDGDGAIAQVQSMESVYIEEVSPEVPASKSGSAEDKATENESSASTSTPASASGGSGKTPAATKVGNGSNGKPPLGGAKKAPASQSAPSKQKTKTKDLSKTDSALSGSKKGESTPLNPKK